MAFVMISVAIQLAFCIHVLKTDRKTAWVIIIGFIPILGWLSYIIVELLPVWLGRHNSQGTQKKSRAEIYPEKDLEAAQEQVAFAATVSNRMKLAEQYLLRERFLEAKKQYEKCLVGLHKNDPQLLLGLAKAEFGLRQYPQVVATLDALKAANPGFKSSDGHLIYTRAQELSGNIAKAIEEYEALIQYYPSPEPTCHFAHLLKANGDTARAQALFMKVVNYSENAGRHYNYDHEEWIAMAKRETGI